uniref:oxysterol-binding protein-related protein 10-like n=1 Tax=Semicossyphus pulcher TaxID=241346 RepID=UPI0037E95CA5
MNRSARQEKPARSSCRRQEQQVGPAAAALRGGSGDRDSLSAPPHLHTARSKRHLEGVLKKYTNLLQGWQSRYFVLDPEVGQLQYYLNEGSRSQRPPRGFLPLLGAMVVSCDDFQYMFTIKSTAGDSYKLRALDAQQQELWMTQLQLCSRRHSDSKVMSPAEEQQKNLVNSVESLPPRRGPLSALDEDLLLFKATSAATLSCLGGCLSMLQHNVVQALNHNQNQNHLPGPVLHHGPAALTPAAPTDRVKSRSVNTAEPGGLRSAQSPTHSFSESPKHSSSTKTNHVQNQGPGPAQADGSTGSSRSPSEKKVKDGAPVSSSTCPSSTVTDKDTERPSEGHQQIHTSSPETPDPSEETTDTDDNEEEELGVQEEQRSIIIHLLSQLKLGMDLTRVVLPTFILEKRSLLEMYANFMAHPDMFLSITSGCSAEERIIRFVEYYLTAFHEGRKGAVAKKPYNPVLGENFHCSWYVPRGRVRPLRTTNCTAPNSTPTDRSTTPGSPQRGGDTCRRNSDCYHVRFVAEQVSHHPPVSGFYCECKERRMCVNTHVWTKSKFMGMSVGVSMVGEGVLYLLEHDEEYVFTLPCAYARSILTVPWVELGGKVTINCAKSGYSASVTFHTKPFYGGKVHRVTAEVKQNQTGNVVCKAQGEWNGVLEFTYSSGENKVIDTSKLPIIRKKMRPLEKQGQYESRRLWQHVTASLKAGNMEAATEHKHFLEERQRSEGKQRATAKTPWTPKYFLKEGEGWVYHNPLWKAH